ncbi:hypothetical protein ACVWXM_002427 [Bradyrhizobium sp. GM7.3]
MIGKENTTIVNGAGKKADIGTRGPDQAQTEETTSDEQHAKAQWSLRPTLGDSARSKEVARGSTLTL